MTDFYCVSASLSLVCFGKLLRYGDKRIVNNFIMKVYIERNNLQVELIRCHKNVDFIHIYFCEATDSMIYRPTNASHEVSNTNHVASVSNSLGRLTAASQCKPSILYVRHLNKGATLAENGDLDAEMTHIIQSGWKNWKRVSGILCDRRISLRVKGKVYKTVVRPAMMYGAETLAVTKAQEKKLDVAEMRMLRWMCGVTKLDRIRNERIRGTKKVGEISKKVQGK